MEYNFLCCGILAPPMTLPLSKNKISLEASTVVNGTGIQR